MNKEKILLIFQTKSRADYWFSWFGNNYQNYIILIKGITKEIHLKNGTVLYFKTLEDNLRGLRCDKEINGERLELLCLNYENNQLKDRELIINMELDKLQQENKRLKEQYCERTDCSGRLGNSRKVEKLIQENKELHNKMDKAIEYINDTLCCIHDEEMLEIK